MLVLVLEATGVNPEHAALVAATVTALAKLGAAGGSGAIKTGVRPQRGVVSAPIACGPVVVLLKSLVH